VVGVRNGGGAAEAKPALREGDIILRLGGEPVARTADLQRLVAAISAKTAEPVPTLVTFVRDAEELVTVAKVGPPSESDRVGKPVRPWLGARTQVLTREIAEALGLAGRKGVRVTHVVPESPAAQAGLQVGDLLLKLDGRVIPAGSPTDTDVFENLIRGYAAGTEIAFDALRGGEPRTVTATLAETPAATGDLDTFKDETFEFTRCRWTPRVCGSARCSPTAGPPWPGSAPATSWCRSTGRSCGRWPTRSGCSRPAGRRSPSRWCSSSAAA
jgi:S1-C subfamily serine protease